MNSTEDYSNIELSTKNENISVLPSRSFQMDKEKIFQELDHLLETDLIKREYSILDKIPIIQFDKKKTPIIAEFMRTIGYTLEGIVGSDEDDSIILYYIFSQSEFIKNSEIILQTSINKKMEQTSIKKIFPTSEIYEKNVFNRLGLRFIHRDNISDKIKTIIHVPYQILEKNDNKAPYSQGIFSDIHQAHYYIHLSTNPMTGMIRSVKLLTGWNYKQIQPKLENEKSIDQITVLLEELSPNNAIHLSLAFMMNLEKLKNITLVKKVQHIRTLLAEIERVHSHLIWFANLAYLLDLQLFSHRFIKTIKKMEQLNNQFFGHPLLHNSISFGSVSDLSAQAARDFLNKFNKISKKIKDLLNKFIKLHTLHVNLREIGIISSKEAILWGLTGPSLRASNHLVDTRNSNPYLSYLSGNISQKWAVVGSTKGDCFARCLVRSKEVIESINIILEYLKGLSNYVLPAPPSKQITKNFTPNQTALSSVEAPHGKLSIFFQTDRKSESELIYTIRIITPDFRNFSALNHILLEEDPEYVKIILHSLDLDFSLIDL
ncbi:MAG: NADH-quinone oxidoreductase subunit C [Candidatus Lokiarchaeota archaeon]|nr:NADH-quinone oxidoreductase subunit C [Candidatus Harpocratesius repetitus]